MRRILEDIVPKDHNHTTGTPHIDGVVQNRQTETNNQIPLSYKKDLVFTKSSNKKKNIFLFFGLFTLILCVIFFVSFYFRKAVLTITPHTEDLVFEQDQIPAIRGGSPDGAELPFEVITVQASIEKPVTLSQSTGKETKAKGEVTIYNNYSKKNIILPAKTELKDSRGLSFVTTQKVTIPSFSVKNKITTPGFVSVKIEAKVAGSSYNGGPMDFTVVGFSKLYARSTTSIDGGSLGKGFSLQGEDLDKFYVDASLALREKLFIQARAQTPEEFLLYRNASSVSIDSKPATLESDSPNSVFGISGTATYMIFKEKDLEKFLATISNITDDSTSFVIKNIEDLQISNVNTDLSLSTKTNITIDGHAEARWIIDDQKIRNAVRGIPTKSVEQTLHSLKEISSVRVKITPFWLTKLPTENNRLFIRVIP